MVANGIGLTLIALIFMIKTVNLAASANTTDEPSSSTTTSSTRSHIKSVFKPAKVNGKPQKGIEKTLIDHLISASSTMTASDHNHNEETKTSKPSEQRLQHLDDLFTLMNSLLTRLTEIDQEPLDKTQPPRLNSASATHRVQPLRLKTKNSHNRRQKVAESVLNACEAKVKSNGNYDDWHCELSAEFDAANPQSDLNFCSCHREYECVEYEQYSIDEIDMDENADEDNENELIGKCEASMADITGVNWNCTLSWNGEGPRGENNMFCDCHTKKKCQFQKILFANEIFIKTN